MLVESQGPEILRGKAFVCAALLCKINRRWLPSLCNAKLLPAVERLAKEKDPYVQQCMEALAQTVVSVVPTILESISTDIAQLASGRRTPGPGSSPARGTPRSSLPLFPVVLNLMNSPTFRVRMVDEPLLERIASFLKRLQTSSFQVSVYEEHLQARFCLHMELFHVRRICSNHDGNQFLRIHYYLMRESFRGIVLS